MKIRLLSPPLRTAPLLLVPALCCTPNAEDIGALPGSSGPGAEDSGSDGPHDGDGLGGSDTSAGSQGSDGGAMLLCESDDPPLCCHDDDADGVLSEDNARFVYNPMQGDFDGDGVGDVIDLCPTVESNIVNSADSDNDGVGNECDLCPSTIASYNQDWSDGAPPYMVIRNNPVQSDADGDGVGDACDNCPSVPNCADEASCQLDLDVNGIGDACEGLQSPLAAGPTGLSDNDDLDQDGLRNAEDHCPRLPLTTRIDCSADPSVCPEASTCSASGVCNHIDHDGDAIGDLCDTCPGAANPEQLVEGAMQASDEDGDFVGAACEASAACGERIDPRPTAFHPVSSGGLCCVQLLIDDDQGALYMARTCPSADAAPGECTPLLDPDGVPIFRPDACAPGDEQAGVCRPLAPAAAAAPGVLTAPAGCDAALATASMSALANLMTSNLDAPDPYASACRMPQFDQDFDSLGDACDYCEFAYDPTNEPYIDSSGRLWPTDGRYCNGEYKYPFGCRD